MNLRELVSACLNGTIQHQRLLMLDTPLPKNVLLPQRAVGESRIGREFAFTVDALATSDSIQLKSLIAQPVTLWMAQADDGYLPYHGYVQSARYLGSDGDLSTYQLHFTSWMHFLHLRVNRKRWQEKTAQDILTEVFNDHPQAQGRFEFAVSRRLPTWSFKQQAESDWNFVHRLMEDQGLYCYWKQDSDGRGHRLVITDNLKQLPTLPAETVNFCYAGATSEEDGFTQWGGARHTKSVVYTTRTNDYKVPASVHHPKMSHTRTKDNQGSLPNQAEVYEYTGAYTFSDDSDGYALARIRMEQWESEAKRFFGTGGVRGIDAGDRFTLG